MAVNCRHTRISHPVIGIKLQTFLDDEGGNFEYAFNEGRTILTIASSDLLYLLQLHKRIEQLAQETSDELSKNLSHSFTLHCAFVPLLSMELVRAIKQVAYHYEVTISLTKHKLSLEQVADAVQELEGRKPLFVVKDIDIITEAVCVNEASESRGISSSAPNWAWTLDEKVPSPSLFSPVESAEMENVFQYGGTCVKVLSEDHVINFKEKKLVSKSGTTRCFQRVPDFNAMPTQHVRLNICGPQNVHNLVKAELFGLLDKHLATASDIPWECSPEFSSSLQQQVSNFVRQYCVLYEISSTSYDKFTLTIKGSPNYLQRVSREIQKNQEAIIQEIVQGDSILSPFLKSPSMSAPKLWDCQSDKFCAVSVAPNSHEWDSVVSMMKKTKANSTLIKLDRIQNADLWEKYKLEGRQMKIRNNGEINEKYLFHGTTDVDPYKIAASEHGIDFRYSSTIKKGLMWGRGSYFAENFSYSSMYAYKIPGDGTKQVMLVSVLTGFSYAFNTIQCPGMTTPPEYGPDGTRNYDTVNGKTGESVVYVVYDHCKTCPAYILTYKDL